MTVDVISCISNGHPDDLFGCLDSYVQNAQQHGRSPRFVIVDPTLDVVQRNESRSVADRVHRSRKVDVECITGREVERFIVRASKYSWVDVPFLTYALIGDPEIASKYGAACNISTLLAGRSKSLVVSAGTRCDIAGSPGGADHFRVHPSRMGDKFGPLYGDVEAVRFYDSIDGAQAGIARLVDEDLLGSIDRVLGRCQSACSSSFAECHGSGRDERIGAVSLGTWGDVGLDSPGFYMLSRQASAMAIDDAVYTANRFNRIVHRAAKSWVTGPANFRPLAFGLCPSAHTVPFLPTESTVGGLVGQSLFGTLLRLQADPQMSMTLPLAVKNAPEGAQAFTSQVMTDVARRVSFTDFLAVMIDSLGSVRGLAEVGNGLLAKISDHSFLAPTTSTWGKYIANSAKSVDVAGSALMRSDLVLIADAGDRILENEHRRSQGKDRVFDDYLAPYEFRCGPYAGHAGPVLLRQISQFGRLLIAWPGLVAAVADLSKNGIRLGTHP